jgi:hypothetical protein
MNRNAKVLIVFLGLKLKEIGIFLASITLMAGGIIGALIGVVCLYSIGITNPSYLWLSTLILTFGYIIMCMILIFVALILVGVFAIWIEDNWFKAKTIVDKQECRKSHLNKKG